VQKYPREFLAYVHAGYYRFMIKHCSVCSKRQQDEKPHRW
jgi:hypothetical protein